MTYSFGFQNILFQWLKWQFFEMPQVILKAWQNFLKFGLNYFSTPLLIKTLFSPWRRYKYFYPRGFDFWTYFETFFSNAIFKVLGVMIRSLLIIIGIFAEILIFFTGLFFFLGWFFLPIFLIWSFYHGFRLLLL